MKHEKTLLRFQPTFLNSLMGRVRSWEQCGMAHMDHQGQPQQGRKAMKSQVFGRGGLRRHVLTRVPSGDPVPNVRIQMLSPKTLCSAITSTQAEQQALNTKASSSYRSTTCWLLWRCTKYIPLCLHLLTFCKSLTSSKISWDSNKVMSMWYPSK